MKVRHSLILLLAVAALISGAWSHYVYAASPEPAGFSNVTLWVNPEYDDPRLLVMLEGKIVGATPPALVRFLVPTAAFMYSAGSLDAQGKYTGGPPARKSSSVPGWDEISYTLTSDTFRVEYYDPNAIIGQPDKTISYDFHWLYPISGLTVVIQQPRTAANFSVAPTGSPGTDADGLTIQRYSYQDLSLDKSPLHYDIAYTKADSGISVTSPQLNNSNSNSSPSNLPLIILVLVSIIVLASGLWVFRSMQTSKAPVRHATGRGATRASKGKRSAGGFCRHCGRPLESSDKFCPQCGNKVV